MALLRRITSGALVGCTRWLLEILAISMLSGLAHAAVLETDHYTFKLGEPIGINFSGGPGNARDWVGIYPSGITPSGNPPATTWQYVDGTQTGTTGVTQGHLNFASGLQLSGDWQVFLLLNDGYAQLASSAFRVSTPGDPLVRALQRSYVSGQPIDVMFESGPGNPKDWVGIYPAGATPGATPAIIWQYVDGTQVGTQPRTSGTLHFLPSNWVPGDYVIYFLLNDGYDVLAFEPVRIVGDAAVFANGFE